MCAPAQHTLQRFVHQAEPETDIQDSGSKLSFRMLAEVLCYGGRVVFHDWALPTEHHRRASSIQQPHGCCSAALLRSRRVGQSLTEVVFVGRERLSSLISLPPHEPPSTFLIRRLRDELLKHLGVAGEQCRVGRFQMVLWRRRDVYTCRLHRKNSFYRKSSEILTLSFGGGSPSLLLSQPSQQVYQQHEQQQQQPQVWYLVAEAWRSHLTDLVGRCKE